MKPWTMRQRRAADPDFKQSFRLDVNERNGGLLEYRVLPRGGQNQRGDCGEELLQPNRKPTACGTNRKKKNQRQEILWRSAVAALAGHPMEGSDQECKKINGDSMKNKPIDNKVTQNWGVRVVQNQGSFG